ncbi:hypothetical protein PFISCL1PPCAC_1593 [Pristionchus fissidentatus]|uniref:ATP-grasp domain-containing protein n=1 Tax=Pristionchus fissidentatus TaxID=1538716 RepID=A0AAV5UUX4_9BILA|nr:hypothetical protein PFISCL1PPCAC_1593 [Pristionchus fissidentatus]
MTDPPIAHQSSIEPNGNGACEEMSTYGGRMKTIIIVLHKYRLSLFKMQKPSNVRVFVVTPPRLLADETGIDVIYQVETPVGDQDLSPLLHKTRELAQTFSTTQVRVIAFEQILQHPLAKMRYEMDIEGFTHEQLDVLSRIREASQLTRRGGIATPKQLSFSGSCRPTSWMESLPGQIGGYPLYVRPASGSADAGKSLVGVTRLDHEEDMRVWIKRIYNACSPSSDWVLEEAYEEGADFVVMCTSISGLVYCISTIDYDRTMFDCISAGKPYALQLYSIDQTRDMMPGLESFVNQTTKALFANNYSGALFIRGFYKGHNDIFLLGVDLQPASETIRSMIGMPRESPGWESIALMSFFATDASEFDFGCNSFNAVINVPSTEGILMHQTMIAKRRTSTMRVAWRVAEGSEIKDSDGVDANVVQVFMTNSDNARLADEIKDVVSRLDIPIDRNILNERAAACRKQLSRLGATREFVRSCTTTD